MSEPLILDIHQFAALRRQRLGQALLNLLSSPSLQVSREPDGTVLLNDSNKRQLRFGFDTAGYIDSLHTAEGYLWQFRNDSAGRLLHLTTPSSLRWELHYDDQGRLLQLSRNDESLLMLSYDTRQHLLRITYADQTDSRFEYDNQQRLSARRDAIGQTEHYAYGPAGELVRLTDPAGRQITFTYSQWNRPTGIRYADGLEETYHYDSAGRLHTIATGTATLAEFDYAGDSPHPARVSLEQAHVDHLRFNYDTHGRLNEAGNAVATLNFDYDNQGRVVREALEYANVQYGYTVCGRLNEIRIPGGYGLHYDYDGDGRLQQASDWNGGEYRWQYAADPRKVKLTFPNKTITLLHHTRTGLLKGQMLSRQEQRLHTRQYQYDHACRLTALADNHSGTRKFRYDRLGRLTAVLTEQTSYAELFSYDAVGNRTRCNSETATFDSEHRLLTQGFYHCSYDRRGNVQRLEAADEVWELAYDHRDLLIEAQSRNGQRLTFGYDAFGRRRWKQHQHGGRARRIEFHWAGEQLLYLDYQEPQRRHRQDFMYLPGSAIPLAMRYDDRVYCFHTDHLGAPLRLTDETGTTVWQADYNAFGMAQISLAQVPNPLRLPGHYCDEETGLHYVRHRYYAPLLGRYLSRDPLRFLNGSHFYRYANNDPLSLASHLRPWRWPAHAAVAARISPAAALVIDAPSPPTAATATIGSLPLSPGVIACALNTLLEQQAFCCTDDPSIDTDRLLLPLHSTPPTPEWLDLRHQTFAALATAINDPALTWRVFEER